VLCGRPPRGHTPRTPPRRGAMTARPLRSSNSYAQARSPAQTFAPQDAYWNRVKIRCPYELAARRRERRAALRDEGAADS